MRRLLLLLYRFRAFMLFIVLEVICFSLIKSNYIKVTALNSSNAAVGWTMNALGKVGDFFDQPRQTEELSKKYAEQTTILQELKQKEKQFFLSQLDDTKIYQFKYIPAKVTKNSLFKANNFITIDKGTEQGVRPGMGVISPSGVVGIVNNSTDNFSRVASILHSKLNFSARLRTNDVIGKIKWNGENPREVELLHIPRHARFVVGDTVETSGYGAIFPEGIMIGRISSKELKEQDQFYRVKVKLSADLFSLHHVLVINNKLQAEQRAIEAMSNQLNFE